MPEVLIRVTKGEKFLAERCLTNCKRDAASGVWAIHCAPLFTKQKEHSTQLLVSP